MKKVKVTESTYSSDEKSIDISVYDADSEIGTKNNKFRVNIEIGTENWENENDDEIQRIVSDFLAKKEMNLINNGFITE